MTAAAQQCVKTRVVEHAGVCVITLSRAEKKNALTPDMLGMVKSAIVELGARGVVRAMVLEGEGAAFCAGFDLSLCKENSEALRGLLKGLSEVIRAMRACPVPVVVAAHGAAIAGGCAMVAAADVAITHNECKLGYPVVRLGISPAVNAPMVMQGMTAGATRERLLSSQVISGWEAMGGGLVHECIEDAGKVRERAMVVAGQIAAKPVTGIRATKAWLNEIDGSLDDVILDRALEVSMRLVGSAEERERLAELWK